MLSGGVRRCSAQPAGLFFQLGAEESQAHVAEGHTESNAPNLGTPVVLARLFCVLFLSSSWEAAGRLERMRCHSACAPTPHPTPTTTPTLPPFLPEHVACPRGNFILV